MVFGKVLLEVVLKEFGKRLVHPPSNVRKLFYLLDRAAYFLSWVGQSPSKSMGKALCQLKKALVADDLMSHSDIHVKVAVASCISEVTSISAPVSPYDDEQMKKIFRLIVDAFQGLSDTSSPLYSKRVSILVSMAKVRSCVVMLDLHCDAMILEMFQHFLNSIRDYHPEHVFSAMETIMTLVLTESDDVSVEQLELISLLLDSMTKKDDSPDRKLAKKVIGNFLDNVAAECNGNIANASDEHPINESKSLEKAGADRIPQEANKVSLGLPDSWLVDLALGRSFQSVMTNAYPSFLQKKPECSYHNTDEAKTRDTAEKIEPDNLESKMVVKPETEPGQAIKKTTEVQNPLERSFGSSDNRDSAFGWAVAEGKKYLIEAWKRKEKTTAAYKDDKILQAIESWENREKAAFEAELKNIEERLGREMDLIHWDAEEKRAMLKEKCESDIFKATLPIWLLLGFGAGLKFGLWMLENYGDTA